MDLLAALIVGGIAGWLASVIMKGQGHGLLMNIVIGIVGGAIGGFVFSFVGVGATNLIGSIITATVGAIILLWIVNKLAR
jgi:uncharacterized membrane protein YeaQ/YmgE (transglycosylase-associated protein family)